MRRSIPAALVGGSLVAAIAVAAMARAPTHPALVVAQAEGTFHIAGDVDGLYPGAELTLHAEVTNPDPVPITVDSLSATVLDASADCPASVLEIGEARETVEVPAEGTATVPLDVHLAPEAPDACQGATWPLLFEGTALGVLDEAAARDDPQPASGQTGDEGTDRGSGRDLPVTGAGLAVALALAVLLMTAGYLARRASRGAAP